MFFFQVFFPTGCVSTKFMYLAAFCIRRGFVEAEERGSQF